MNRRPYQNTVSLLGLWFFSGLLLSLELYFSERTQGGYVDVPDILITQFGRAGFWTLLTPWVLELGRRVPPVRVRAFAFHLTFAALVMAVFYLGRLLALFLYWNYPFNDFWRSAYLGFYGRNIVDVVYYYAVLTFGQSLQAHHKYRQEELRAAQLQSKLVEAELRALKHQLDPHFLFNTLNSVTVLIRDGRSAAAVELIAKLSALLRISLESNRVQTTTLRQELDFLVRYLEIQKLRFGDKLSYETRVDPEAYDAVIPNLILQPAVENAIVHGIAKISRPGRILIGARIKGEFLELEVSDDGPGCKFDAGSLAKEGIGLSNTRVRLERHYGRNFQFSLSAALDRGVRVLLVLPYALAQRAT